MITHLSFTRIKELLISPACLQRYIQGGKLQTDAMADGAILDCLTFEPEKFEERFYVLPDGFRRPTAAQINAKKPTDETVELVKRWNEILESGKIIIKPDQLETAMYLAQCVQNNSTVVYNGLLNDFQYQIKCTFEYRGIIHTGIKEAEGRDRNGNLTIWDLKRMGNTCGERDVYWQIRKMKYYIQAAIYCYEYDSQNIPVNYYVIAVDNDGNVTPFEISKAARMDAYAEWHKAIHAAHRIIMSDDMSQSCEFWAGENGFFKY